MGLAMPSQIISSKSMKRKTSINWKIRSTRPKILLKKLKRNPYELVMKL